MKTKEEVANKLCEQIGQKVWACDAAKVISIHGEHTIHIALVRKDGCFVGYAQFFHFKEETWVLQNYVPVDGLISSTLIRQLEEVVANVNEQ